MRGNALDELIEKYQAELMNWVIVSHNEVNDDGKEEWFFTFKVIDIHNYIAKVMRAAQEQQ